MLHRSGLPNSSTVLSHHLDVENQEFSGSKSVENAETLEKIRIYLMTKGIHVELRESVEAGRGSFDMVHPATAFVGVGFLEQFVRSKGHSRRETSTLKALVG